jgi:hypothetical protein
VRILASPEAVSFIRAHGGQLFVWTMSMVYGAGDVFVLEASTESPGAERSFARFTGEGVDILFDGGAHGVPDELHLAMRGWPRKQIRALWNGNSFGRA